MKKSELKIITVKERCIKEIFESLDIKYSNIADALIVGMFVDEDDVHVVIDDPILIMAQTAYILCDNIRQLNVKKEDAILIYDGLSKEVVQEYENLVQQKTNFHRRIKLRKESCE